MNKKILVVDDEPDVITYLKMMLTEAGFEVVTASDGMEGLEQARKEKPDLVVLDLLMPKNTGVDFYRKMRKDKEIAKTPVIIVSAIAGRNLAVGQAVAVFDKPVEPEELVAAINQALGT